MYYSRIEEEKIKELAEEYPCIVLYGPRQCGKSTLVKQVFGDKLEYVTLDDIDELNLALNSPKLFLQSHPTPCVIDEIQKAPPLLSLIKKRIDEQKEIWMKENRPYECLYILAGSNTFLLQQGVSESLAGRASILELNSFSQAEKDQRKGRAFEPTLEAFQARQKEGGRIHRSREGIFQEIFEGGMPEIVTHGASREEYFKSYISTYLLKDVRLLISKENETQFRSFLSYLALRTGQEIQYTCLAQDIGIDVKTLKRYLSILEASGIIVFLQPYMKNASSRIIKAPKLYFMDTGLCTYLCGWASPWMLEHSSMAGAFFETYVVSEVIKSFLFRGLDFKQTLFYYRDIDQREIDLLYVKNQRITPIEIKKGLRPNKPSKNFDVLSKYGLPIETGFVLDTTDQIRPINEKVYSVPVEFIE